MDNDIDLLQIKIDNAKKQLPEETLRAIAAVPWQAEILKMRETKGYSFEQLGDLELETELLLCGLVTPSDYPKELENRMRIGKAAANELVAEMNELVFAKIKEEMIKNSEREKIFRKNSPLEEYPKGEVENSEMHPPRPLSTKSTPQEGNNQPDTAKEKIANMEVLNKAGIEIIPARNAFSIADAGGNGNGNEKKEVLPIPDLPAAPKAQLLPAQEKLEIGSPVPPLPSGEGLGVRVPSALAQKMSGPVKVETVKTEHTLENITKIPKIDPYREIPE
ncbi:MAG: hypothetical protein WAN61_04180 [Minisyncoccia bacterium]